MSKSEEKTAEKTTKITFTITREESEFYGEPLESAFEKIEETIVDEFGGIHDYESGFYYVQIETI
jgi:hypothetical protein